jgi:uracil-DNA glycosylase
VALYPSLVRKTVSIASATKVRAEEVPEPAETKKPPQSVAATIAILVIAVVIVVGLHAAGTGSDKTTRDAGAYKNAAPITSGAELAKAIAHYDGSRTQGEAIATARQRYDLPQK